MITKRDARNVTIDWKKVDRATEINRTYELLKPDNGPGIIFKSYKPSQLKEKKVFGNGNVSERYRGWFFVRSGIIDRSGKSHADKKPKQVFRERRMKEMLDERNRAYCY